MHSKFPAAFDPAIYANGKSPTKAEKVMNKKGSQRRFAAKMTLGDSNSEVFTARFDPTDKYIAAGFGDGAIRIYNTQNGKCSFTLCSLVD